MSLSPNEFGKVYYWVHDLQVEGDPRHALFPIAASFREFLALLRPFEPSRTDQSETKAEVVWVDPELLRAIKEQE
jgi:hypothetical protein